MALESVADVSCFDCADRIDKAAGNNIDLGSCGRWGGSLRFG